MCDYCDCRQQEPLARLSEEHDRLLALSVRIRAALRATADASGAEVEALLAELLAVLRPHAEREERGLFPALAADEDLGGALVPVLLAEHAELDVPIERSEAGIAAFLNALGAHIRREEHDVFPAAAQLLAPAAWEAIAASGEPATAAEPAAA